MRTRPHLVDTRLAIILSVLQVLMTLIAMSCAWFFEGAIAAKSIGLGAGLCCLANAYFAWQSFRFAGAHASKQVMLSMYRGLMGKFAIVIVGLIVIFSSVKPLLALALFIGFMLVQAMSWIAPMLWSWWVYQSKRQ